MHGKQPKPEGFSIRSRYKRLFSHTFDDLLQDPADIDGQPVLDMIQIDFQVRIGLSTDRNADGQFSTSMKAQSDQLLIMWTGTLTAAMADTSCRLSLWPLRRRAGSFIEKCS